MTVEKMFVEAPTIATMTITTLNVATMAITTTTIVALGVAMMTIEAMIVTTLTLETMIVTKTCSAIVNKLNHFSKIISKYVISPIFYHNQREIVKKFNGRCLGSKSHI